MNKTTIYFDMDGTIADFYGVENWLSYLEAENALPYIIAKPLVRLSTLAKMLNLLQKNGYRIGIISWTSKYCSESYFNKIACAKMKWLANHLPSVHFDEIRILHYGTPKFEYRGSENDILFDDESPNRTQWGTLAYDEKQIFNVLKNLLDIVK